MENKSSEKINFRADLPRPTLVAASGLVLLAAIGLWVANLVAVFLPADAPMVLMTLINLIYYLPFVLIPIAAYMIRRRGLSDAMRLNPLPVFPTLSVMLLGVLSTLFASVLTALWSGLLGLIGLGFDGATIVPSTREELMLSVIVVAAIPAVCEELLFRGFVMSAWESRGTKYAIWVSAVFFALIHGSIYGLPAYLFVGALSGYLVFSLDSVYAGMIYHTVYNTACLVINYFTASKTVVEDAAMAAANISIASLIFSMVLELFMGALMIVMTLFTLKMRRRILGIEPIPRIRQPLSGIERAVLALSVVPMIAMMILI